jgi:hypothetical protein
MKLPHFGMAPVAAQRPLRLMCSLFASRSNNEYRRNYSKKISKTNAVVSQIKARGLSFDGKMSMSDRAIMSPGRRTINKVTAKKQ